MKYRATTNYDGPQTRKPIHVGDEVTEHENLDILLGAGVLVPVPAGDGGKEEKKADASPAKK